MVETAAAMQVATNTAPLSIPGIAEDLGIDEDDVDHRQERGQAGNEFGTHIAARLVQAEPTIEHGLGLLRAAPPNFVHGLPPSPDFAHTIEDS